MSGNKKLEKIKEDIENMNRFHQIEILKCLKKDDNIQLNENKNGIFINLSEVSEDIITDLENYILYVNKQEAQLGDHEKKKENLQNTNFDEQQNIKTKINKDIGINKVNYAGEPSTA